MICRVLAGGAACLAADGVAVADVDFAFDPISQTVMVGDIVEVRIVLSSSGSEPEEFDAIDAIFTWDPAVLDFIDADQTEAEADFFLTGFLPDPDGINKDLDDGDALFTALAPPGTAIEAPPPPESLIVTTLQFEALEPIDATEVAYVPSMGVFGQTRALRAGIDVTGDIRGPAFIEILPAGCVSLGPCPGDIDESGVVGFADLLSVLSAWGPCPGPCPPCCREDLNRDCSVGFADLIELLAAWGPCPP